MNGFHSAWRGISAHESASTTGKNSANSTVGNSKLAEGREWPLRTRRLALHVLGLQQEEARELDQVGVEIGGAQLEPRALAQLGADRLAVAGAVEQRDQQPRGRLLHTHGGVGER